MVGKDTEIMHSVIENSTILSGTKVARNVSIESSLIGKNVTIGKNSKITNMIVDHDSVIPDDSILNDGQWP